MHTHIHTTYHSCPSDYHPYATPNTHTHTHVSPFQVMCRIHRTQRHSGMCDPVRLQYHLWVCTVSEQIYMIGPIGRCMSGFWIHAMRPICPKQLSLITDCIRADVHIAFFSERHHIFSMVFYEDKVSCGRLEKAQHQAHSAFMRPLRWLQVENISTFQKGAATSQWTTANLQ